MSEIPPQAIRKLAPGKLVIATHNAGKVKEIRALLEPYGINAISAGELDLPEPEETGTTFVANAELKALYAADLSGLPALADDSGLCVDALNGDPGVYTANWAETADGRDWMLAMTKVEQKLTALGPDTSRSAHFVSTLALAWPDGHVQWFEGRIDGTLIWPPRREHGLRLRPDVRAREGDTRTYAEMPFEEKQANNHRAKAFAANDRGGFLIV